MWEFLMKLLGGGDHKHDGREAKLQDAEQRIERDRRILDIYQTEKQSIADGQRRSAQQQKKARE